MLRREACESITTRRRPPALPGARSPWSESRVGRLCWASPPDGPFSPPDGPVSPPRAGASPPLVGARPASSREGPSAGPRGASALTGAWRIAARRAGASLRCSGRGARRCAGPDRGAHRCAGPDRGARRCAGPGRGGHRCAGPGRGARRCAGPDRGGHRCAGPDRGARRCDPDWGPRCGRARARHPTRAGAVAVARRRLVRGRRRLLGGTVAVAVAEDPAGLGLVDGRGRSLHLEAGGLEPLEHLFGGKPALLGDLMHTFIHLKPV